MYNPVCYPFVSMQSIFKNDGCHLWFSIRFPNFLLHQHFKSNKAFEPSILWLIFYSLHGIPTKGYTKWLFGLFFSFCFICFQHKSLVSKAWKNNSVSSRLLMSHSEYPARINGRYFHSINTSSSGSADSPQIDLKTILFLW